MLSYLPDTALASQQPEDKLRSVIAASRQCPPVQVVDVFTLPGPDLLQEGGPSSSMTTRGRYDLIAGATVAAVGLLLLRRREFATTTAPAPLP